jgi:hypothetical protein
MFEKFWNNEQPNHPNNPENKKKAEDDAVIERVQEKVSEQSRETHSVDEDIQSAEVIAFHKKDVSVSTDLNGNKHPVRTAEDVQKMRDEAENPHGFKEAA